MTEIRKVAVFGAGVMGAGIAGQVANAGVPGVLLDIVLNQVCADAPAQPGLLVVCSAGNNLHPLLALGTNGSGDQQVYAGHPATITDGLSEPSPMRNPLCLPSRTSPGW